MGSLNLWQNGHRGTRFAIATPDSICKVVIDVGLCRSGRIGGAAGSFTSGYSRKRASRCATISAEGKKPAFPDQKRVCRNAHRRVMMKAAPTSHFVIPQPDSLEFFVIAFDRPTAFGCVNQPSQGRLPAQCQKPIFGRISFSKGPLNQQPLFVARSLSLMIEMSRPDQFRAEMRTQFAVRSFTPRNWPETVAAKLIGKLPHCHRLMLLVPAQQLRLPAPVAGRLGRKRSFSWRPNSGRGLNANRITQSSCGQFVTKVGVVAKGDIRIDDPAWQTGDERSVNLSKSNFVLGAKPDLARHASLLPTRPIIGPSLRQIEIESNWQRSQLMRNSERDGDLAIIRLAQLATVLPLDPDRMLTAFWKPSVVNNPAFDLAQMKQGWQCVLTNHAQERTVIPGCDCDEVMQRLMFGAGVTGINPRCDRLNAFSPAMQEQPRKIIAKRRDAISVIKLSAQQRKIVFKPLFAGQKRWRVIFHHPISSNFLGN
jgi:hypothetical protein